MIEWSLISSSNLLLRGEKNQFTQHWFKTSCLVDTLSTAIWEKKKSMKMKKKYMYAPRQPLETILHGTSEGGWSRGWQRKRGMDNVKEWTFLPMPELLAMASSRNDLKKISAEPSLMLSQGSNWSRNWTELICMAMLRECWVMLRLDDVTMVTPCSMWRRPGHRWIQPEGYSPWKPDISPPRSLLEHTKDCKHENTEKVNK